MDVKAAALKLHSEHKGKISIESKVSVKTNEDLALAYTPGVAEPCKVIAEHPEAVYDYTAKGNLVGLISDGSAVLGMGNIGPEAAIPVMEGKSILFKEFANIDTMPLCLATQDTAEIIKTVQYLAPSFGGINLEDISSPRCFEIEKVLDETLDIPVFHDDQHGTAIVVAAGVINGLKLVGKDLSKIKVVLNGPGAAGTAIIKMLLSMGVTQALICDEHGILAENRQGPLDDHKRELAILTNPANLQGDLGTAIVGADVFVGVSVADVLTAEMVQQMAAEPIVFAMANPVPEIMYEVAKANGVKVMGTGRSDFPNQINNVLAFPGIFRGALDVRATTINKEMKIAAAEGIAALIASADLREDYIIPSPFDPRVVEQVAKYVSQAAVATGVNRIPQERL